MASSWTTPSYQLSFDSSLLAFDDPVFDIISDLPEVNLNDNVLYSSFDDITPLQMSDKATPSKKGKGKRQKRPAPTVEPDDAHDSDGSNDGDEKRQRIMDKAMQHQTGQQTGPSPRKSQRRDTQRSRRAAEFDDLEKTMTTYVDDWQKQFPDRSELVHKIQLNIDASADGSDEKLKYMTAMGKFTPHFINRLYDVERNSNFSRSNLQSYHRVDESWFDNNFDFNNAPFTSYTIPSKILEQARCYFKHDGSRSVNYLSSYRYSIDSSLLPAEPAIFYTDRLYAYWCRHVNPSNDRHPVCFRCQLAYSLPICFIHTSWPCEFCLLSPWEDLRKRTNRICKLLNSDNPFESWCTKFHSTHKLPARINNQLDAYSGKKRVKTNAVLNVSDIVQDRIAKKASMQTAASATTGAGDGPDVKASQAKAPEVKQEAQDGPSTSSQKSDNTQSGSNKLPKAAGALARSQGWYINSRNQKQKEPHTFKHDYRRAIYNKVVPNMCYWARRYRKDAESARFDMLCLNRMKYFSSLGDPLACILPTSLPERKDPLPPAELKCIENLDSLATTTEDDDADDSLSNIPAQSGARPVDSSGDSDANDAGTGLTLDTAAASSTAPPKADSHLDLSLASTSAVPPTASTTGTSAQQPAGTPKKPDTGISLNITATGTDQGTAPPHYDTMFSTSWDTTCTLYAGPSLQPFRPFYIRLNEVAPDKYKLPVAALRHEMSAGHSLGAHAERAYYVFEIPQMPEDKEFVEKVQIREKEIEREENSAYNNDAFPLLQPTQQLKVNVQDYSVNKPTISIHSPSYGIGSNLKGLKPDQRDGKRAIVYPVELRRLQEIARTQSRISQYMRWILHTPLGMQMPGEARDAMHTMLDDHYKCSAEILPNLQRIQQRAAFTVDEFKDSVRQLHGHSITNSPKLLPR